LDFWRLSWLASVLMIFGARNPNGSGRVCTVDLLVLTSLDQLSLILKPCFSFFLKQPILMRRSRTEPSSSLRVPCTVHSQFKNVLIFFFLSYRIYYNVRLIAINDSCFPYPSCQLKMELVERIRTCYRWGSGY
jgi:hypothetical protein